MLPSVLDFRRRDAAQRVGRVARFVVASDVVAAFVTAPKWKGREILTVRVNFRAVGQTRVYLGIAAATVNFARVRHPLSFSV